MNMKASEMTSTAGKNGKMTAGSINISVITNIMDATQYFCVGFAYFASVFNEVKTIL